MKKPKLLPRAFFEKWNKLKNDERLVFMKWYNRRKKSYVWGWVSWLFGLHYAYMGKWGNLFLFWFTLGGLGVWWIIDFFRMYFVVKSYNEDLWIVGFRDVYKTLMEDRQENEGSVSVLTCKMVPPVLIFLVMSIVGMAQGLQDFNNNGSRIMGYTSYDESGEEYGYFVFDLSNEQKKEVGVKSFGGDWMLGQDLKSKLETLRCVGSVVVPELHRKEDYLVYMDENVQYSKDVCICDISIVVMNWMIKNRVP